jgi:DNA segregation ATPase FtsK/SpoIIIE-like protein
LSLVAVGLGGTALAQPDVRDHRRDRGDKPKPAPDPAAPDVRDHRDRDDQRRPRPPATDPTEAPPAPRDEAPGTKAGYVWVRGEWDWKAGKWEWVAGHWERERPGKRWRESRWEDRGGRWQRVDGDWIDDGSAAGGGSVVVTQGGGGGGGARPRPLDRAVVSSYWPPKGKPGTRIVVRGRNFPTDARVMWGGRPVRSAKVTPTRITIEVPDDAASGAITLEVGGRRPLPIGAFEVAAAYDADAEAKRIEDDRRRAAEVAWATRQKQLAKDRAAREAAWRTRRDERVANRDQRRAERADAIRARWDRAFLADEETQAELTLHAQRTAELERMAEVAELADDAKLGVRIGIARDQEAARHADRMSALRDAFEGK